jgi:hypothetical protein
MESKGDKPGKITLRIELDLFFLSKTEITELPQRPEPNATMARVSGSRVVWSDVQ